jgi:hypothetical protein
MFDFRVNRASSTVPLRFKRVAVPAGLLLLVLYGCVYLVRQPMRPEGPPLTDFAAYVAAGRAWLHGIDPYGTGIWIAERTLPGFDPARFELLPYVGPPAGLPLWAALSALPYPFAALVWGAFVTASAFAFLVLAARLADRRLTPAVLGSLGLIGVAAAPIVTGIVAGQTALPAAAAVGAAIWCARQRRWVAFGAAAVAAACLKPNDALAIAACARAAAAVVALAAAAVTTIAVNVPFVHGFHGAFAYLHILASQTDAERDFIYQFTPASIAYAFGAPLHAATIAGSVLAVVLCIGIVAAMRATRADLVDGAAIGCAFIPFMLPYVHEHDFTIALLPALFVVLRGRGAAWIAGSVSLVVLASNPLALAHGWSGLAFTAVMGAVLALQLAALAPRACRRYRYAPLLAIPILAAVTFGISPQRIDQWPDALPARYPVAGAASASAVWRAEIVASGLTERRPWTAVLRLVTLLGCAGIGFAMLRVAAVRAAERARELTAVPIIETQVSMVDTGPPRRQDRNIVSTLRSRRGMSVARGREPV